uniref:Arginase n=1 Tax=Graphocephala atropunctata TaxID=36148 RepID=A0A1B6M1L0_9HEMI
MGTQFKNLLKNVGGVSKICCRTVYADIPSYKIGVIGVPFSKGQANDEGVGKGPEVLRKGGMLLELIKLGHNVRDYGDINCEEFDSPPESDPLQKKMKDFTEVAQCNHQVSKKVQEMFADDSKVLLLGGDHSVVVGSVDAHVRSKGDLGLIYVDAHADLNTADTSPSGNIHGMTVALLVKEFNDYWPYLPGMDWQKPELSVNNLAYIGLRSVDKFERLLLDKYSITAFGMAEVEKYGIHKVTEMALDKVDPMGTRSLHVSFDIDSLDTLEAPATGVPVRGGLSLREGIHIMEIVHNTGRLNAMDIVEVNPILGHQRDIKKTVQAAIHVVKAAFGFSRLGNVPKNTSDIPGHYSSFKHFKE